MVVKLSKEKLNNLLEKILILLTVFYSFSLPLGRFVFGDAFQTIIIVLIDFAVLFSILLFGYRISRTSYVIILLLFLLITSNIVIFNLEPVRELLLRFLFGIFPMVFAGLIIDFTCNKEYIYHLSILCLLFNFIYVVFFFTKNTSYSSSTIDYMGFAYQALPAIFFIMIWFYENKSVFSFFMTFLGIAYLLLCGTRGPLLCLISLIILIFLFYKPFTVRTIIIKGSISLLVVILLTASKNLAFKLMPFFETHHLSTRILLLIIKDDYGLSDSGRSILFTTILHQIRENWYIGTGLGSDRLLLNGLYSHNIILEVLLSFGIPIGVLLLITFLVFIGKCFYMISEDISMKLVVFAFVSFSLVKLLFSSSFILEGNLFILMGIVMRVILKPHIPNS